jgi:hypothetical protein
VLGGRATTGSSRRNRRRSSPSSATPWYRRSRSFSSALRAIVSRSPRRRRSIAPGRVGSPVRIARSASSSVISPRPSCGPRPHSSSYSTTPSEYTSVRVSIAPGSPAACSGLMYASVPTSWPSIVWSVLAASDSVARAIPKSSTFTAPAWSTRMLPGFRSRWITPRWCACVTPSHTERNSRTRAATPRPAAWACSVMDRPSTSSIAKYGRPSRAAPTPNTCATHGWRRRPRNSDSSWNRRSRAPLPMPDRSSLSATRRRGRSCSASYTTPIPPSPIGRTISNPSTSGADPSAAPAADSSSSASPTPADSPISGAPSSSSNPSTSRRIASSAHASRRNRSRSSPSSPHARRNTSCA